MRYYKTYDDGYIISVGSGGQQGETITKDEYDEIVNVIKNIPIKDGYYYRLKLNLSYEEFKAEEIEIPIEPDDSEYTEAGKILLGVSE